MIKTNIPYSTQLIEADDLKAVIETLKSKWLTQGPKVEEFEKRLARYVGAKYAVAVSNGTAALEAAFFAAGIKPGDEVISSPLTFAATTNAALWLGAKPVFCDIDAKSGNIDPWDVESKITKKTKIIAAVDYSGMPADIKKLRTIAKKHKLILLEDAAQALGSSFQNKMTGSISDMTIFSFHPVKSITTGEGGAIVTNNFDYFQRLLIFRNHGIVREKGKLERKNLGDWYFEMQALGHNLRMPDIQAALGVSQLSKINGFIKVRRKIAKRYQAELREEGLILPQEEIGIKSSWHLFPVRLTGKLANRREGIFKNLRKAGIHVQIHHIPVYWHPYYRKLGYKKGLCPKAEAYFESELSIPIFPSLTFDQQTYVIKKLKEQLHAKSS